MSQPTYSLWLSPEPTSMAFGAINSIIETFAQDPQHPRFLPHMTLYSSVPAKTDDECISQVQAFSDSIAEKGYGHKTISLSDVSHGSTYFQCVLGVVKDPFVFDFHQDAVNYWGEGLYSKPFRPHVSLIYGDLDSNEKAKKEERAKKWLLEQTHGVSFNATSIKIVDTGSPNPESWRTIASVKIK
ncbi:hypothetical protein H4219_001930 [Mycoemilia scoparia]|uniref:2',3'-cyclic-nucleotide 3'-phosphodiesterase n=1 Tax=Mycoemilia scoparia TaxID=417184 RepID=A0A9W8DVD8_9FUNG|nr:hypothetical protein H4219_001930 [Mycoemilia scoparia]